MAGDSSLLGGSTAVVACESCTVNAATAVEPLVVDVDASTAAAAAAAVAAASGASSEDAAAGGVSSGRSALNLVTLRSK